jgi:hypothetical protein
VAVEVGFNDDMRPMTRARRRQRTHWVDGAEYPVFSECFECIRIVYCPDHSDELPSSNLLAGFIGARVQHLTEQMNDKLAKLPGYRSNVPPATPIHLLIWSRGTSSTRRFRELDVRRIQSVLQKLQETAGDSFDAAWWGRDLFLEHPRKGQARFLQLM